MALRLTLTSEAPPARTPQMTQSVVVASNEDLPLFWQEHAAANSAADAPELINLVAGRDVPDSEAFLSRRRE